MCLDRVGQHGERSTLHVAEVEQRLDDLGGDIWWAMLATRREQRLTGVSQEVVLRESGLFEFRSMFLAVFS